MAVGTFSTTTWDKFLLEHVQKGLEKQYYLNTKIYGRFKSKPELLLGKYGVSKVATHGAAGGRPSSSTSYPTALQGRYNEFTFYIKRGLYRSMQFDGLILAAAQGEGAVKDLLKTEIEGAVDFDSNLLNKQFWGDGSGRLARIDGAVSNTTAGVVDGPLFGQDSNDYTDPGKYLHQYSYYDIYDASGNREAHNVQITALADQGDGHNNITFGENVTCSDNAFIFFTDTYAASEAAGTGTPMGLYGIISDDNQTVGITATSAFQGINRATAGNEWAQAQEFDMGSAALTNKKMLEVIQNVNRWGSTDVMITNEIIWRNYYTILEADKTMPNEKSYWGGLTGLTFYGGSSKGIPIIFDEDCPDNRMYFMDSSKIHIASPDKGGPTWVKGTNGVLYQVQGKDEFAAHLKYYYNMTTNRPKALAVLFDIKHAES